MSKRTIDKDPAPTPESLTEQLDALQKGMKTLSKDVANYSKAVAKEVDGLKKTVDGLDKRVTALEQAAAGSKPEPKKDEPKPDPKKDDPKKDEPKPDPKKDEPKPDPKKDPKPAGTEGLYRAYKYWDPETGCWYVTESIWTAVQGSRGGEWCAVWALYKGGQIDHILTPAEIRERKLAAPV